MRKERRQRIASQKENCEMWHVDKVVTAHLLQQIVTEVQTVQVGKGEITHSSYSTPGKAQVYQHVAYHQADACSLRYLSLPGNVCPDIDELQRHCHRRTPDHDMYIVTDTSGCTATHHHAEDRVASRHKHDQQARTL